VQIAWLVIIAAAAAPLVVVGLLLNPFVYLAVGRDRWRAQLERLYPYRRAVLFLLAVCAFSVAVYTARWG
jgi:hypothetical protein